ncbi:hypothetical protein UCRPC4_g05955 [Phaeomoniella chlamydospora]|uniref:ADP-ribosylglycohydrolase n=1 Tax=Phaeomoniella chlamydospora TaxID=158046 RepID=A0A0G2FWV8_PHACM|nr:hypothetical protein UCRPC4_g05955 [Phaeomoniella chlamydospora]
MAVPTIPPDYLERVYAGVLGKLIGVYLGRPFEGWTHQRIMNELGTIRHYVHEQLDVPLVVTDDDVSGTFLFLRALEEHGYSSDISPEAIGKTWLNNIVEKQSVLWWGGNGISTEHTAFLNLKRGIPAPRSGSIEVNGQTIAEQIGAQIFIDGWAMVCPGDPVRAAKLARAAASVSHDGEAVFAAQLLAAMEAEAFVSKDVNHLLDTGLSVIPMDCLVSKLVRDIRSWAAIDKDWLQTRQRIEDSYGYDKFPGICHMIPNHGLIILALIYGGNDFHVAMSIVNTCGWDTDCNSGNVGCLVALMHGLQAFEGGPDWRGPIADRALISSADGGFSVNNAAHIALDITSMAYRLAGSEPPPPKAGAQFHFSLPGSVQGFMVQPSNIVNIEQGMDQTGRSGLAIHLHNLGHLVEPAEVLTETFTSPDITKMHTYNLMACPLLSPGQKVTAVMHAEAKNPAAVNVQIVLKVYGKDDLLHTVHGPTISLLPGSEDQRINWTIPDNMGSQPIQKIGLSISTSGHRVDGTIWLDSLSWSGVPSLLLKKPSEGKGRFWKRSWIQNVHSFQTFADPSCWIAQDSGEGIIIYGTRDWVDYQVVAHGFQVHLGALAGIAVRVRGLNRFYALLFKPEGQVAIIKARDDQRTELVSTSFKWQRGLHYEVSIIVTGDKIHSYVSYGSERVDLEAKDHEYAAGGIGVVVADGSASVDWFKIGPPVNNDR